jgi:hypothetical protein
MRRRPTSCLNEQVSGAGIEKETVEMVRELHQQLTIPIAIKLSPFHASGISGPKPPR